MLLQGHRRRGREKDVPLSFGDATTHFSLLPGTDRRDVEGERELAPVSAAPRSSLPSSHAFQAECLHFAAGRVRDSVILVPGVGGKRSYRPCLLVLVKGHPSNTVLLLGLDFFCLASNLHFPGICIFIELCSVRGLNCVY